jgi:hypothetical protein
VSDKGKPWGQQEQEPTTWWARFLCFLHLGPTRTLEAAYRAWHGARQGTDGHTTPASSSGAWRRAAKAFRWRERALAHDAANLETAGLESLVRFNELLARATDKLLGSIDSLAAPTSWEEFEKVLHAISPYISPELLRRFQLRPSAEPPAAAGGTDDAGTE